MDLNYVIVLIVFVKHFDQLKSQETCDEIIPYTTGGNECSDYDGCYPMSDMYWYQNNFWGGFVEIAWTESSISSCSRYYRENDFLVLLDKPPLIENNIDTVLSVEACIRNQEDTCKEKVHIDMKNCSGNTIIRFPWVDRRIIYVCLDYVFSEDCGDSTLQFTAKMVDESVIEAALVGTGWYSTFQDGKQYMFPSLEYTETVFNACPDVASHFLLQDRVPKSIEETPLKLRLCGVTRVRHGTGTYYNYECKYFMYMRKCNGKIQFETTWTTQGNFKKLCLGNSDEDENEFTSATVIGIIVGIIIGLGIITLLTVLFLWKRQKRKRAVRDSMGTHDKECVSNDVELEDSVNHNEA